jgi:hypothetical protein
MTIVELGKSGRVVLSAGNVVLFAIVVVFSAGEVVLFVVEIGSVLLSAGGVGVAEGEGEADGEADEEVIADDDEDTIGDDDGDTTGDDDGESAAEADERMLSMTGTSEVGTSARVRLAAALEENRDEEVMSGVETVIGVVEFRNGAEELGAGVLEAPAVPREDDMELLVGVGVGVGLALLEVIGREDDEDIPSCVAAPVSAGSSEVVGLGSTLVVSVSVGSASSVGSSVGSVVGDELEREAPAGSTIPEGRVAGFPSKGIESES